MDVVYAVDINIARIYTESNLMLDKKENSEVFYPAALTIGASDSGGSSGIQADLRTFNAYGIFGCSAVTAVTAQNPFEISGTVNIPPQAVALQIDTVLRETPVKFAKCGHLPDAEYVETVANAVKKHQLHLVFDATSADFRQKELFSELKKHLLPAAKWVVCNILNAELLLGRKLASFDSLKGAALDIYEKSGCSVVLKGNGSTDAICCKGEVFSLKTPAVEHDTATETHGCGDTFSAAVTAGFAMGMDWKNILTDAAAFVLGSMRETAQIGPEAFVMYPPTEDCRREIKLAAEKKKK